MLETLFDEAARTQIAEAVATAEAKSTGQIVPVVVERSDPFSEGRYRGAVAGTLLASAVALIALPHLHSWELAAVQVAGWVLSWLASAWDPLERLLIGRRLLSEASQARAVRAFHEHGLNRTPDGTGVLVFASLFERSVVILGDHGINAQMGPRGWQEGVDLLAAALRQGRPAQGLVDAIHRCGQVLERCFPRTGEPVFNTLDNQLRLDKAP